MVPAVGVVITNYNNARFVAAAIVSVAEQSVRDLQVVVVDDASTDDSDAEIQATLARLADPRFRYVKLASNVGQAGAMRRGLAEIDTAFVCFLDSDDYWYPNFVERHLAAHLNTDFPVALTFCDSHIVDGDGRMLAGTAWWFDYMDPTPPHRLVDPAMLPRVDAKTGKLTFPGSQRIVLRTEWSLNSATNTMSGMMYRRSFVDLILVPADRKLTLHVDFYLSTLAALLTGTAAIYDSLYAYRMHGHNLHSNGLLHGGTYNSSRGGWDPIRTKLLKVIEETLKTEAAPLRQAFGAYHCDLAEKRLAAALAALNDPPQGLRRFWLRLREGS